MSLLLALTAATGSPTGTIAFTEGDDSALLAGLAIPPTFTGLLTFTEAADSAALAGTIGTPGTLTYTESPDTAAFAGSGGTASASPGVLLGFDPRPYRQPPRRTHHAEPAPVQPPAPDVGWLHITEADDLFAGSLLVDNWLALEALDEELLLVLT